MSMFNLSEKASFGLVVLLATILAADAYEVRPQQWHLKLAKKQMAMKRSEGTEQNETATVSRTAMRGNRIVLHTSATLFSAESALLESVQWYIMLVYVVPSVGIFLFMVIFRRFSGIESKLKERDAAMEEWEGTYNELVNDLQECLSKTLDSEVELIEQGFNNLARDFRSDLKHIGTNSTFSKEEFLGPLKAFVMQWVSAFNDWLLDPSEDPPPLVTEAELDACSDVSAVSALMVGRLTNYKVDLTTSDGQDVQRLIDKKEKNALACSWMQCCGLNADYLFMQKPGEGGWPRSVGLSCVGITFFSPKHVVLLVAFLVGPLVTIFEYGTGGTWGWLYSAYVSGAWICLLIILFLFERIDELARVEVEIEDLKKKRSQIVHFHVEVKKKYNKITKFNNLWEYRSLPCLRLMKAMFAHVYDSPEDAVALLNAARVGFLSLDQDLGPKEFWYGSDAPPGEKLKLIEKLLESHKDFVADKGRDEVLQHADGIFQPFSMLSVRIKGCRDLHRGNLMDKSDPYVRVRLGSAEWKRTKTQNNKLNPTWDTDNEFAFFPKIEDVHVDIEVKDDDLGEDTRLGHAKLKFRDTVPTQWIDQTKSLEGVEQGEVIVSLRHTMSMKAFLENPSDILKQVCLGEPSP